MTGCNRSPSPALWIERGDCERALDPDGDLSTIDGADRGMPTGVLSSAGSFDASAAAGFVTASASAGSAVSALASGGGSGGNALDLYPCGFSSCWVTVGELVVAAEGGGGEDEGETVGADGMTDVGIGGVCCIEKFSSAWARGVGVVGEIDAVEDMEKKDLTAGGPASFVVVGCDFAARADASTIIDCARAAGGSGSDVVGGGGGVTSNDGVTESFLDLPSSL